MDDPSTPPGVGRSEQWRALRVRASGSSIILATLAIVAVFAVRSVFDAASQPLGWLAAAASIALVVSLPVRLLSRWLPRLLAIAIVYLAVLAGVATLGVGLYVQVEAQLGQLGETLPAAARELEDAADDDGVLVQLQFGDLVEGVVDDVTERLLPEPDVEAAGSVPAYFVTGILAIFLMIWASRLFEAARRQISDPVRRERFSVVATATVYDAQAYVVGALGVAAVVGVAGGLLAAAAGLPSPLVLGVLLALGSLVPSIGILFGSVPMLIVSAAFEPGLTTALVAVAVVTLQIGAVIAHRNVIVPRSVRVGPAALVVIMLIGFEVYGVGGVLVGAVAAVVLIAAVEARSTTLGESAEVEGLIERVRRDAVLERRLPE